MRNIQQYYGREYAPNTRETKRRQTMHQFVEAGVALHNPDNPARPVNSPKTCYRISDESGGGDSIPTAPTNGSQRSIGG